MLGRDGEYTTNVLPLSRVCQRSLHEKDAGARAGAHAYSMVIGEDGGFSLTTMRDRACGAPEGDYSVVVLPPLQGDHKGAPPITVTAAYKVEAKDNSFSIELEELAPCPQRQDKQRHLLYHDAIVG